MINVSDTERPIDTQVPSNEPIGINHGPSSSHEDKSSEQETVNKKVKTRKNFCFAIDCLPQKLINCLQVLEFVFMAFFGTSKNLLLQMLWQVKLYVLWDFLGGSPSINITPSIEVDVQ